MILTPEQVADWKRSAEESKLTFDAQLGFVANGGLTSHPVPASWSAADWLFHKKARIIAFMLSDSHEALRHQLELITAERDALRGKLTRTREALRQVEWSGGGHCEQYMAGGPMCPMCDQVQSNGHSPDCLFGMALEDRE